MIGKLLPFLCNGLIMCYMKKKHIMLKIMVGISISLFMSISIVKAQEVATISEKSGARKCTVFGDVLFHRTIRDGKDRKFDDAGIPSPIVKFSNKKYGEFLAKTTNLHSYKIEVPPSRYSIDVRSPLDDSGFVFQRAKIDIRCRRTGSYKFNLNFYVLAGKSPYVKKGAAFDTISIKKSNQPDDRIVVGYSKKKKDSFVVRYKWGLLTLDSLTIFAERIEYNPEIATFMASGYIWAEFSGNRRVCYKKLTLRLLQTKLRWEIVGGVMLGNRECHPDLYQPAENPKKSLNKPIQKSTVQYRYLVNP